MADDLAQPGTKRLRGAQCSEIGEGDEERVLHGILGTAAVAQHQQRGRVRRILMVTDQLGERFQITREGSLNQGGRWRCARRL